MKFTLQTHVDVNARGIEYLHWRDVGRLVPEEFRVVLRVSEHTVTTWNPEGEREGCILGALRVSGQAVTHRSSEGEWADCDSLELSG